MDILKNLARIQNKARGLESKKDFGALCRAVRIKWYFRNDILPNFCEKPAFTPKSKWKLTKGYPSLEVFLSQIKKKFFNWLRRP